VRGLGLAGLLVVGAIVGAAGWSALRLAAMSTQPLAFERPSGAERILLQRSGNYALIADYVRTQLA
jgi:hypothetical protein